MWEGKAEGATGALGAGAFTGTFAFLALANRFAVSYRGLAFIYLCWFFCTRSGAPGAPSRAWVLASFCSYHSDLSFVFLLGLKSELRIINIKSRKILKSIKVEDDKPLNRINDGKTDLKGRLWFGTMDNPERKIKNGSLYCLDKKLTLHKVDKKYYITNGPAFINNDTFLHTDSGLKTIFKIKINKKFKIIKKIKFLKFSKKEGSPDGMTIDSKKNIWICHYGGACITVYNLKGKRIHKVNLPAKNITNCTFGGNNINEIFVTSALKGMKKNEFKKYNFSGSLFNIKTNIKGVISKPFNI